MNQVSETTEFDSATDRCLDLAQPSDQVERLNGYRGGSLIGYVARVDRTASGGQALWVDYPSNRLGRPLLAESTVALDTLGPGDRVVLLFEESDTDRPIVVGALQTTRPRRTTTEPCDPLVDGTGHGEEEPAGHLALADQPLEAWSVEVDGKPQRVQIDAQRELVLRCGDASITLTRAGKVLIRGKYVSTRSAGVNRVKGATVEIN